MKRGNLWCCALIVAGSVTGHASLQADAPPKSTTPTTIMPPATAEGLNLSAKTDKTSYAPGEGIMLVVTLKNMSRKLARAAAFHPLADYKISIIMPNGQLSPLTAYGKQSLKILKSVPKYSRVIVKFRPGQYSQEPFLIGRSFDMSLNGKYQILVTREVLKQNGSPGPVTIGSKMIEIKVLDRLAY